MLSLPIRTRKPAQEASSSPPPAPISQPTRSALPTDVSTVPPAPKIEPLEGRKRSFDEATEDICDDFLSWPLPDSLLYDGFCPVCDAKDAQKDARHGIKYDAFLHPTSDMGRPAPKKRLRVREQTVASEQDRPLFDTESFDKELQEIKAQLDWLFEDLHNISEWFKFE